VNAPGGPAGAAGSRGNDRSPGLPGEAAAPVSRETASQREASPNGTSPNGATRDGDGRDKRVPQGLTGRAGGPGTGGTSGRPWINAPTG
jgi:hypothetical protein